MEWYVAIVPAQRELDTQKLLEAHGYRTLVPIEYKWRRKNRYSRSRVEVKQPLLPRYVFVGIEGEPHWWHLRQFPWVQSFLGRDGFPKPLPPEAVRALEGLNFTIPTFNPHRSFRAGDQVQFAAGPMNGKVARVRRIVAKRARVLVEVFNSLREVEVPLEILEAA